MSDEKTSPEEPEVEGHGPRGPLPGGPRGPRDTDEGPNPAAIEDDEPDVEAHGPNPAGPNPAGPNPAGPNPMGPNPA